MSESKRPVAPAAWRGGERARQALMVLLGLVAIGLSGIFVALYLHKMRFAYFTWIRRADLIYVAVWISIAMIGLIATLRRKWMPAAYLVLLLMVAEGGAQAYVYLRTGVAYRPDQLPGHGAFEPHPLLVGIPRPGTFDGVVHTPDHRRRTFNESKTAAASSIFAFGGSTTYDILVNDDMATWSSDLSRLLGEHFSVENLGVPGYSSAEMLVQTLFAFRDRRPTCAIYLLGGNDLRNANIKNLKVDYSDFHLPSQVAPLSLRRRSFFINNLLFLQLILATILPDDSYPIEGAPSDAFDPRLNQIFMDNIALIANIGRHFGVKVLLVLEVVYYPDLTGERVGDRMPFVRERDMKPFMEVLDQDLELVAQQTGAFHIVAPKFANWVKSDFIDDRHFTPQGSQRFAEAIPADVARECR